MNKNKKNICIMLIDLFLLLSAYFFMAVLDSNFFAAKSFKDFVNPGLFVLPASYFLFFYVFGLHNIIWRYLDIDDMTRMVATCICSLLVFSAFNLILAFSFPTLLYSLTVSLIASLLVICSRLVYKYVKYIKSDKEVISGNKPNLAIIGAGNCGASIAKNFRTIHSKDYNNFYFFDDDPQKINRHILGFKIWGPISILPEKCKELKIDEILIAIPSATKEQMNKLVGICMKTNCKFFMMPLLHEVSKINPQDYIRYKRKVHISDLLGRDEVVIKDDRLIKFITGKTVLVTGGGGSIGSELCRQIAMLKPKKLIILDIYENNAYDIEQELKIKYKDKLDLCVEIASVRDNEKIDFLFSKYRPDIVFHAAAHKHVPLMENNPEEAIKNNVFGTYNVIMASDKYGAEKFILISSDKAVNPTNIMGATKRICEMIVQSMKNSKTLFSAVRFGNVLGSNGSVVPLFMKQIEKGGPVTVTDKRVIRYFMTIPEAVLLVLEASRYSKGGEVFVLDMGDPVNIDQFARKLIKLMGFEPDKDIKVVYTGLRPGEKLFEELILDKENCYPTENKKIFIEKLNSIDFDDIITGLEELKQSIKNNNPLEVAVAVKNMVDTYNIDRLLLPSAESLFLSDEQINTMKNRFATITEKEVIS